MSVAVDTACHHCAEPIRMQIDDDMSAKVLTPGAEPVVFVPDVVPFDVDGPDIVDDF